MPSEDSSDDATDPSFAIMPSEKDSSSPPVEPEEEKKVVQTTNFWEFPVAPTSSVTEEYFGTLGPLSRKNGWAVIPQERTDRRLPGKYNGQTIKWGLYQDIAPPFDLTVLWAEQHFNTNVAVIMGKPSGYVWALDIDVTDRKFSGAIERIAYQTLGHTEFRRLGNRPKQALFYRASGEDDLPKTKAFTFMNEEGTGPSPHMLEIQAAKRVMTLYGRHYKTLRDFTWTGYGQPGLCDVMDVPFVTKQQFEDFMAAVQELRPFHRNFNGRLAASGNMEFVDTGGISVPKMHSSDGCGWVEEDGIVTDGRERYLAALVFNIARANPASCQAEEGRVVLERKVREEFSAKARVDGKWATDHLDRDIHEKVQRAAGKVATGEVESRQVSQPRPRPTMMRRAKSMVKAAVTGALSLLTTHGDREDRSTAWLSAIRRPGRLAHAIVDDEVSPTIPEHLQIPETAAVQREQVMSETRKVIRDFFRAAMTGVELTWLVKAPPGSGKTWNVVDALADMKTSDPKPVLFLLPTYNNIDEQMVDAEARGLNAVRYESRARTGSHDIDGNGCHVWRQMTRLQEVEKPTAGMCGILKEGGNPRNPEDYWSLCPRRFGTETQRQCRFYENMGKIPTAGVVFAVHQYMTVATPGEFDIFSTIVVDESIRGQLSKTKSMPASVLTEPRSIAYATKKELAENRHLFDERSDINKIILEALMAGEDPADWIINAPDIKDPAARSEERAYRLKALRGAISVCSRTKDSIEIQPNMTDAMVEKACAVATLCTAVTNQATGAPA